MQPSLSNTFLNQIFIFVTTAKNLGNFAHSRIFTVRKIKKRNAKEGNLL